MISNHDTKIVIDCGSTQKYLKESFKKIQCEITDLDACLITHTHTDHISCLKMFNHLPIYSEHDTRCLGYIIQDQKDKLVYITDTGYLKECYYEKIKDADYYIFESNHDLKMLIQSRRPEYVKNRIRSANGHLCNEDCARHLRKCVGEHTRQIVLAHISEEANSKEKALSITQSALADIQCRPEILAAPQFEIINGGQDD